MYIKDYMTTDVITVNSDTLINDAQNIMRNKGIQRLPVVDKGRLVGLVTREKIKGVTVSPGTPLSVWELHYLLAKMKVSDVMEKEVKTVTPDMTLEETVTIGQSHGIGAFPVVKNKKLVGIVTITDLYKVTSQVMGFGRPGVRLHIFEPGKAGRPMGEITGIINRLKVKIVSLVHVTPPGTGREDCIIHLDTEDAGKIINELRRKGYDVEERS